MNNSGQLIDYFKEMYESVRNDWNAEASLKLFGKGTSNEGSQESKTIKRYYVQPDDKRFCQIYLNFDNKRIVESIVWFLDKDKSKLVTLRQLRELFGSYEISNIIHDDSTEFNFYPNRNRFVKYVRTTIGEWIEKRKDGTMFFTRDKDEFEIDEEHKVVTIIFKIDTT